MWALTTLGSFEFRCDGLELDAPNTKRGRALLVYLAWQRGEMFTREHLVETFWPECDGARGRANLKTALWSIRRCLGKATRQPDEVLFADKNYVAWMAPVRIDARQFEESATKGSAASRREALACYCGEFLPDDYSNWSGRQRERLSSLYEDLLQALVAKDKDVAAARRLIARGAFDELPYAVVAQAELAAGRQRTAATVVMQCRAMLAEVGTRPSAAFDARFRNVLLPAPEREVPSAPFCGRTRELQCITGAFEAARTREGCIVVVLGGAGSGRTALLRQAELLAPSAQRVVWMQGPRADEDLEGCVVIVDDAHGFSEDALAALVHLAHLARQKRLCLLVSARNERDFPRAFPMTGSAVLRLSALALDDLRSGLSLLFERDAGALAQYVHERTAGIPFLVAGTFDSLLGSGAIQRLDGRWTFRSPQGDDGEVPRKIRDFVKARLRMSGVAAVDIANALALDTSAQFDELAAVCGIDESAVLQGLDELLSLQVIEQSPSGPAFRFAHDLIRRSIVADLNAARRSHLHRAFAKHVRNDRGRDSLVRRAHHLQQAQRHREAAHAFLEASSAALQTNAWAHARDLALAGVEAASVVLPSADVYALKSDLYALATRAAEELGHMSSAAQFSSEWAAQAAWSADRVRRSKALSRYGCALLEIGPAQDARVYFDEALSLAASEQDDRSRTIALVHRAACLMRCGEVREAEEDARLAVRLAERIGDMELLVSALGRLLILQCMTLQLSRAQATCERARRLTHKAGPNATVLHRCLEAAFLYLCDRHEAAQAQLDLARPALEGNGWQSTLDGALLPLTRFLCDAQGAMLAIVRSDWERALECCERLSDNAAQDGYGRSGIAMLYVVEVLLGRGSPKDLAQAHALAARLPPTAPPGIIGWGLTHESALARIAARTNASGAKAMFVRALKSIERFAATVPIDYDRHLRVLGDEAASAGLATLAKTIHRRAANLHSNRQQALPNSSS